MAKYPIKMLLDELQRPFFPLVTIDTIVTNNSDKTLRQLFEDRYTKAEVDKLISDLGTLQRLRGTVNSYEELLAIENPMPGDTYILLVETGNNTEYMYIGDKWEVLGTTASYTDVYSKEVVDKMLLALKQELNTKTERDDAEVLSQAKAHAEGLFANIPDPNLDEYYKKSETDAKIDEKISTIEFPDSGEVLPIGTMLPYASTINIPTNWKICDGSEVSRTDYAELFNVIGTAYGAGDGETTFNLPDKRGRVSVSLDLNQTEFNSLGLKGGEKKHTLKVNEIPHHAHPQNTIGTDGAINPWVSSANSGAWGVESRNQHSYHNGNGTTLATGGAGGDQAHNNLQPYEVDVWIIKVSNLVSSLEETTGTIIDNLTSTSSTDALSANMGRELKEKNNWKLHATTTGPGAINLPSEYNELYIEISNPASTDPIMYLYIPRASLTASARTFRKGYYFNSSIHGAFASNISLTTYKTADLYISGTSYNASALTNIYYR